MNPPVGVIQVCEGCKDADPEKRAAGIGGGPELLEGVKALVAEMPSDCGIAIEAYGCIGNCVRRVRLSVAGPGKWSWLLADLSPADLPDLGRFVTAWLAAPDGLVVKNDRPPSLRPKFLGRVPPIG